MWGMPSGAPCGRLDMDIEGRRILVTGAAGGLGAATVRALASQGARVVLSGRNESALAALADEVGGEVDLADLCDREQVDALAERAAGFDVLVLNAGVGHDPLLAEVGAADVDTVLDTNLRAPMLMAFAFVQRHLATATPGALVFVGSVAGVSATPGTRLYNASKFGLRGFVLSLRQELHGTPVSASLVAPGFIRDAGMFATSGVDLPPGVRTRTPDNVADAVVRAIRKGPAEVFVAPPELRLSATFAGGAPALGERVLRLLGAGERRAAAERTAKEGDG
jgi:uncharacterized protein